MQKILKICRQSSSGGDILEEQPVNSGAPDIAIHLRTYVRASFHRSGVRRAFRADMPTGLDIISQEKHLGLALKCDTWIFWIVSSSHSCHSSHILTHKTSMAINILAVVAPTALS